VGLLFCAYLIDSLLYSRVCISTRLSLI
jgi:hypothetical protein